MSVIQVEDLVSYQLRAGYLNDIADGVGERVITLNEAFLNTAPFKAAGWRPNPSLIKRTHSPPITAIASDYFNVTPRARRFTLEDEAEAEDGGLLAAVDTIGPGLATKRRRRREQMMEDDDSSDLTDESDDDTDQRAAQQIKFAKMPVRNRSGSSPIQSVSARQPSALASPRPGGVRRGSQSALEAVKERARRDTVTSSEVSSDNEFDASGAHKQREAARAAARALKLSTKLNSDPAVGIKRQESELLEGEEDEDSDVSDLSSNFVGSMDSASVMMALDNPINASPREQLVGTPPRAFARRSTIRRSAIPAPLEMFGDLPPARPMSALRPLSMIQPKSLLTAAFHAMNAKPAVPFEKFASLSGQGDPNPIMLRIYTPFSEVSKPFEVRIRRIVHQGESGSRPVTVADLIGLSLWRYNEEKREPPLPSDKLNVNWWMLRMVEEDGEVDDDFPPLDRSKHLTSFTTANNRAGRGRSNSRVYDSFALIQATPEEFAANEELTPEIQEEDAGNDESQEITPRNTPQPQPQPSTAMAPPPRPYLNPIITTQRRQNAPLADMPQQPHPASSTSTLRGQQKLLRIHIHSSDVAPGQMVTLDVTTETYLAEVLDMVCRKRHLDKANHVLKLPGSGVVVLLDRTVSSIGNVTDLELYRRRFATDGPLSMTGSPSSSSPQPFLFTENQSFGRGKKGKIMGTHPLAKEAMKMDELGSNANYRKYTVWRKQPMRFAAMNEHLLVIDGEYIHIRPASQGRVVEGGGKKTTVHFSNVIGCKTSRKHPTAFKVSFVLTRGSGFELRYA
ncbi:stress-activated map kinase interacting protein 1-domain-containing protein [Coniochaeta sp. 2T2.1]|nr:stress-activated map kinase interacting protein 1-domain-containing protein [Coniochaeta sp. 2T2.1]